jgi:DNA polymerase-3 subunit gamma/tau
MEKKKKPEFIIPPTYYRRNDYSISEVKVPKATVKTEVEPQVQTPKEEVKVEESISEVVVEKIEQPQITQPKSQTISIEPGTKVSAMSLASIRAKKEMAEAQKSTVKEVVQHVNEPFTETEMLEQWLKYAQRMEDKGYRIIASLLTINDPILEGTTIIHELPNESSKIDFEKERPELLGYLRGKLHNHDISIEVKVNETLVLKKSYTTQDKYNRLVELNPNLELMRNLFGLEVNE